MSTTLLRLALWIMVLVLALYVIAESYPDQPIAELIPTGMLQQALVVAGILLVIGLVMRVLGKGARAVTKNRCKICRAVVPHGAIYCREHLRSLLHDEDEKTHMTRLRR